MNRWTEESKDFATYPRLTIGKNDNNKNENSSLFLYNASYLRLKNVEIGYTLPKSAIRFAGVAECSFLCTRHEPAYFLTGWIMWMLILKQIMETVLGILSAHIQFLVLILLINLITNDNEEIIYISRLGCRIIMCDIL